MFINLVKVDTHGNKIALYRKTDKKNIFYIKESMEINSNKIIEREYQGYKWFFNNILKKKNLVEIERGPYNNIKIPKFSGKNYSNEKKFHLQKNSMLKLVNFYKNTWPRDNNFSIHGDMGLSNFIINNDNLILIDWEHFHKSNLVNYGFDIINMLFISFYYRIRKNRNIHKSDRNFIRKCYRILFDNISFNNAIIDRPFYNSKYYIKNNYQSYINYNANTNKKFILSFFPDKILNQLDYFVTK